MSCPGCGATGLELSNVQDARATVQMPPADGPGRAAAKSPGRLPVPEATPYEGDLVNEPDDAGRGRRSDLPRPSVVSDVDAVGSGNDGGSGSRSAGGGRRGIPVAADDDRGRGARSADDARASRVPRRGEKRRGIGLMLTGGFAGIAVVGFLVYGNTGGDGSPAGNVVSVTTGRPSTVSNQALTVAISATIPASSERAASASASPTHTASDSPSPSMSPTPQESTSSAPASRSASPTATKATTSASPTSTGPTASPSPSSTQTCWFIFC